MLVWGDSLRLQTRLAVAAGILALTVSATAHENVIRLWPGVAPGSEGWAQKEVRMNAPQLGGEVVRNVVEPTLTVLSPPNGHANGTAMIVCPGGAFQFLSWNNEGTAVAEWLNKLGVSVFLLKYRVKDTGATEAEFQQKMMEMFRDLTIDFAGTNRRLAHAAEIGAEDGRRAVEIVRKTAAKWRVDPNRVGIIGFSAGASVAINVTTKYTEASRPSFTASIYGPDGGTSGVPKDAPAIFLLCASDDPIVPAANSVAVYSAWKSSGHSAELHIYNKGGHGFGMAKHGLPVDHWTDLLQAWLSDQGLLTTR